jgi:hypothetical protein
MIAMGVRAQYRRNRLAADGAQNRLDMSFTMNVCRVTYALPATGGTGVNNRNIFARAHQPGLRACISVRRRVRGQDPTDQQFVLLSFACLDGVGPIHHRVMAHCRQKKKGRFAKTALTGLFEKGS